MASRCDAVRCTAHARSLSRHGTVSEEGGASNIVATGVLRYGGGATPLRLSMSLFLRRRSKRRQLVTEARAIRFQSECLEVIVPRPLDVAGAGPFVAGLLE